MISILALKAITDLTGVENYFIVTSSTNGLIGGKEVDFGENNVWEVYGNKNYYQCDHGKVFTEKTA